MRHMPIFGQGGFTLLEERENGRKQYKELAPDFTDEKGFTDVALLPNDGKMHDYILFFPLYNDVKSLTVGLDETANVQGGKKYRDELPILFLTKPDGFQDPQGEKRAQIVRQTYLKAKRQGDKNVYFLHGKHFYKESEREYCSVDGCHPNDLGFYYMAKAIYRKIKQIDKKFE